MRFRSRLVEEGVLTEEEANRLEQEAYAAVDEAVEFAESSPEPDVATIEEGVYA